MVMGCDTSAFARETMIVYELRKNCIDNEYWGGVRSR
jgi:hypothetical protein